MNTKTVKIRQIPFNQTYSIRHLVLRPGRDFKTCFFEGDKLDTTFHFAAFVEEMQAGIISLFKNNHPLFKEKNQYQIRGMAVLENFRKYGFGKTLIEYSEEFLRKDHVQLIWCNARQTAVHFYKKQGYQIIGEAFEIPDVGIHYVMFKKI